MKCQYGVFPTSQAYIASRVGISRNLLFWSHFELNYRLWIAPFVWARCTEYLYKSSHTVSESNYLFHPVFLFWIFKFIADVVGKIKTTGTHLQWAFNRTRKQSPFTPPQRMCVTRGKTCESLWPGLQFDISLSLMVVSLLLHYLHLP